MIYLRAVASVAFLCTGSIRGPAARAVILCLSILYAF